MRLLRREGQALIELAVFGAVALAALGFLMRIGLRMHFDQEIRMAAFRRGLAAAGADNGTTDADALGTLYYYVASRQMANPNDGYMSLPRTRTEASAFVEWGDRFTYAYDGAGDAGRKTETLYVVRSNGTEQEFRASDFPRDETWRFGPIVFIRHAFTSIVNQGVTTNTSTASIAETGAGSVLNSGTTTCDSTTVMANGGTPVGGCVSSGTSVAW